MLGSQSESGSDPDRQQIPSRWPFHVTVEPVDRCEHEAGEANVRSHERAVSQQIRIEHQKSESDETGGGAEHFLSGEEYQKRQKQREN